MSTTQNGFSPSPTNRGQVTLFKTGRVRSAFEVTFDGSPLTWTVQPPDGTAQSVVASRNSVPCQKVEPRAECQSVKPQAGTNVTFGYTNPNAFAKTVPLGIENFFSGPISDLGQPIHFFDGKVSSVFSVAVPDGKALIWNLEGRQASSSSSLPPCLDSRGCFDTPVVSIKSELDDTAMFLSNTLGRIAKRFLALNQADPKVQRDYLRSKKTAEKLLAEAQSILLAYPEIVTTCPDAQNACATTDNQPSIDALRSLYRRLWVKIKRVKTRIVFTLVGKTKRGDFLFNSAKSRYRNSVKTIDTLPRFSSSCSR